MIPDLYNKDRSKTFFFWNEEWRKIKQGNSPNIVNTLPAADFPTAGQDLKYVAPGFATSSAILVPSASNVGDPAYAAKLASLGLTPGQPFPNNTIPAALFDPNAVAYLNTGIVPKPNLPNDQIASSAQTPLNVRDDVVRIDHRINDKWQILAHYLHDSVTQAQGGPMIGWSGASYNTITSSIITPSNSAAVKLTGSITPTLLAEVSMNYDGNQIDIVNSPNSAEACRLRDQPVLQQQLQERAQHALERPVWNPGKPRLSPMAQCRPGLQSQGGCLLSERQALHEVRPQL